MAAEPGRSAGASRGTGSRGRPAPGRRPAAPGPSISTGPGRSTGRPWTGSGSQRAGAAGASAVRRPGSTGSSQQPPTSAVVLTRQDPSKLPQPRGRDLSASVETSSNHRPRQLADLLEPHRVRALGRISFRRGKVVMWCLGATGEQRRQGSGLRGSAAGRAEAQALSRRSEASGCGARGELGECARMRDLICRRPPPSPRPADGRQHTPTRGPGSCRPCRSVPPRAEGSSRRKRFITFDLQRVTGRTRSRSLASATAGLQKPRHGVPVAP